MLDLPLKTDEDRYINFARLAEERYGFAALYPRLAAQQEFQARAAAAVEAVANEGASDAVSGDEMSLDASDAESSQDNMDDDNGGGRALNNNNNNNNNHNNNNNGANNSKKKATTTRKRQDGYDKDDPFIDDSELLWQEQAATSKDGFFVWDGPLLRPGEQPVIERYGSIFLRIMLRERPYAITRLHLCPLQSFPFFSPLIVLPFIMFRLHNCIFNPRFFFFSFFSFFVVAGGNSTLLIFFPFPLSGHKS